MPDIFTEEWYDAMLALANSRDDLSSKVPKGEWKVAIEIEGDGKSPYIPKGDHKYFFVHMVDGKIVELKPTKEKIPGKGLNYRISGPAEVFESMAAGLMDPIEKGLDGTLTIRGDMRLLMQNADLANIIFDVYKSSDLTDWPKGKPPYDN
ncbi:MAG: SCP2 sterol-binding domain-containing protein [Desulfobacterales bacterium]